MGYSYKPWVPAGDTLRTSLFTWEGEAWGARLAGIYRGLLWARLDTFIKHGGNPQILSGSYLLVQPSTNTCLNNKVFINKF